MLYRRNEYDVTNSVNTTDPRQVSEVVCLIYRDLYRQDTAGNLRQAFDDLVSPYRGEYPGYYGCDTDYHDIQHVMDVTLAMARLMDGCVRATTAGIIDERLFRFGIITALYPEFVRGGIARQCRQDGGEEIVFASAADLVFRTPRFYQNATKRLKEDLGGDYCYIEKHFGGPNLYFDELDKNINYARAVASEGDVSLLRRRPPVTTGEKPADEQLQLIWRRDR